MMLNSPSQERGTIYVPFMFIAVLMSAAVLGSLASTDSTRRIVNKDVEQEHLENLGNSLVTLSGAALWEGFMRTLAVGDQPTLSAMKNYLDVMQVTTTIAPPPGYMSTFEQGGGTEITDYHAGLPAFGGNNTLGTTSSLLETGFAYEMGLATDLTGGLIYAGANVLDLDIERRDVSGGLLESGI